MTAGNKNRSTLKPYKNNIKIEKFETNSPTLAINKFLNNHNT